MKPTQILKSETQDLHELVESSLGDRFFNGDQLSKSDFISLLSCFYRVYEPLERRLVPSIRVNIADYEYEKRTDRIESDLITLGMTEEGLEDIDRIGADRVASLNTAPEIYGCLYVVEGSEMGNRVRRSQLNQMLPEDCLAVS